jgi:RNA polymerase sigma-70 factor (ECF subfamily)
MHPALVNGAAGMVATRNGVVFSIASVIVHNGKIAEMDVLADPERLTQLDLTILDRWDSQSTRTTAQRDTVRATNR